jgi:hypothetical protein
LSLSLADAIAFCTNDGVVAKREFVNKILDIGSLHGLEELGFVGIVVALSDVAGNGVRKNKSILHHCPAMFAPKAWSNIAEVDFANFYAPLGRFVKTQKQLDQGGLSATRRANNSCYFALRYCEAKVFEHLVGKGVVSKRDLVEVKTSSILTIVFKNQCTANVGGTGFFGLFVYLYFDV